MATHPMVLVGAALLICTSSRAVKFQSALDQAMLQGRISVSSAAAVSMSERLEQPLGSAYPLSTCQDQSGEAVGALYMQGMFISGCRDEQVPALCEDETYGPSLKMLCPVSCDTCEQVDGCQEDDFAAKSVLKRTGVDITGCLDPMIPAYCSVENEQGRYIRHFCKKTCAVGNCTRTGLEDDDKDVVFPSNASARDDPHVINLKGERFSINQPASRHLLLRVPPGGPDVPALLELHATVAAADASGLGACQLYMQRVIISGTWLRGREVEVRPLRRNQAGSNGAGNATVQNFSVRAQHNDTWRSFADIAALQSGTLALSPRVAVEAQRREEYGKAVEGQSFVFRVSGSAITVSQASHQALNIDMAHMGRLGMSRLGGLLGTEWHDPAVEIWTDACSAARAAAALRQQDQPSSRTPRKAVSSLFRRNPFMYTARWQ